MAQLISLLRRAADLTVGIAAPLLAPLFSRVARTGTGSDACLRLGFLPLPVHYYSPVPDIRDLERRRFWERRSELAGVAFRPEAQLSWLARLGGDHGRECTWAAHGTGTPGEFYTENSTFSYGCAASTHVVLRHFQPKKVIEIGSGFSSMVISEALRKNGRDITGHPPEYTIVDPYPGGGTGSWVPAEAHLIRQRVELLDISFFETLSQNDVLFIDSGHTVRTGGDVNFLYLEVLPRLKSGVVIHVHDVPLPGDYPEIYFTNPRFRMFWTETYLLQAFLCFNSAFEILLAMGYLMDDHMEAFKAAFPHFDPHVHQLRSSSFWMRRTS